MSEIRDTAAPYIMEYVRYSYWSEAKPEIWLKDYLFGEKLSWFFCIPHAYLRVWASSSYIWQTEALGVGLSAQIFSLQCIYFSERLMITKFT